MLSRQSFVLKFVCPFCGDDIIMHSETPSGGGGIKYLQIRIYFVIELVKSSVNTLTSVAD